MYLKHIYLSGDDCQSLQKLCREQEGVMEALLGIIIWQDAKETEIAGLKQTAGIKISYNPPKTDISTLFDAIFAVWRIRSHV